MKVIKHKHMNFIPLKIEKLDIQSVLIVWYIEFHSWRYLFSLRQKEDRRNYHLEGKDLSTLVKFHATGRYLCPESGHAHLLLPTAADRSWEEA